MKRMISFSAMFLFVLAGFSLGAQSNGRIVIGQVTHTQGSISEGVESTITFESPNSQTQKVDTDWEGYYSTSVDPSKDYSCTASNSYGSQTQSLSHGQNDVEMNFDF